MMTNELMIWIDFVLAMNAHAYIYVHQKFHWELPLINQSRPLDAKDNLHRSFWARLHVLHLHLKWHNRIIGIE